MPLLNLNAYLGIEPDALKVYSQRAEVLAANLANADTPGYLARDIDFRAALAAAGSQDDALQPATTSTGDLTGTSASDLTAASSAGGNVNVTADGSNVSTEQFLKYRVPLAPSLDGNTVDSQMEESQFAQNTVRFQAALTFLENRFSELTTAIVGQ
jgi:flagellar basal-body rod protein FlgB